MTCLPSSTRQRAHLMLECLEARAVCSIAFLDHGSGVEALLRGTEQADRFTLRLDQQNPQLIHLSDGVEERTVALADLRSVAIEGLGEADTLVLDQRQGIVGRDEPSALPIYFDGGRGTDQLLVINQGGEEQQTLVDVVTINVSPGTGQFSLIAAEGSSAVNVRYVEALYQERLGRMPGAAEQTYWLQVLQQPTGRADVAQGIAQSSEAHIHQVQTWYETWLGRMPAATGPEMQFWLTAYQRGARDDQVATTILASDEYYRHQQDASTVPAAEAFIQGLFRDLLQREGSSTHIGYWVNAQPILGRAGVVAAFLQSQEYRLLQVTDYYTDLLGRQPDAAGLEYWLAAPLTLQDIRLAFETSPELVAHVTATV